MKTGVAFGRPHQPLRIIDMTNEHRTMLIICATIVICVALMSQCSQANGYF